MKIEIIIILILVIGLFYIIYLARKEAEKLGKKLKGGDKKWQ